MSSGGGVAAPYRGVQALLVVAEGVVVGEATAEGCASSLRLIVPWLQNVDPGRVTFVHGRWARRGGGRRAACGGA